MAESLSELFGIFKGGWYGGGIIGAVCGSWREGGCDEGPLTQRRLARGAIYVHTSYIQSGRRRETERGRVKKEEKQS